MVEGELRTSRVIYVKAENFMGLALFGVREHYFS
jgi:hypothetical protein